VINHVNLPVSLFGFLGTGRGRGQDVPLTVMRVCVASIWSVVKSFLWRGQSGHTLGEADGGKGSKN
jgi:hypothetical protein